MLSVDVAHIQADACVVGHDIGSFAALLKNIVDARGWLDVFTHQINAVCAQLGGVNRAASQPGCAASMGGGTKELNAQAIDRCCAVVRHGGFCSRMPV